MPRGSGCLMMLIFVLSLFGCGGGNEPDHETLVYRLESLFNGMLEVSAIDLEKTGQAGNLSTYNVNGELKLANNLYEQVAYIDNKAVISLTSKQGKSVPFSATLQASGNQSSGWNLKYSNLTFDKDAFLGTLSEVDVSRNPDHYLKAKSSELEATAKRIQKELTDKVASYKDGDKVDLPALRQSTTAEVNKLRAEKRETLNKIRADFRNWRQQFSRESTQKKALDDLDTSYRSATQKLSKEEEQTLAPWKKLRSKAASAKSKAAITADGKEMTLAEINEKLKGLSDASKSKRQQLQEATNLTRQKLRKEYDAVIDEQSKITEQKCRTAEKQFDLRISETRRALELKEKEERSAADARLKLKQFQLTVADLIMEGHL